MIYVSVEVSSHFNVQVTWRSLYLKCLHPFEEILVFANGSEDWDSVPGRVIPKTQEIVLDISLLNTPHYKVRFKVKVEQFKERDSVLSYTSVL